jgi:hypothetical protein
MSRLPGGYAQGVAERKKRYRLIERCAESTENGIKFLERVLNNEGLPIVLRMMAFDRLIIVLMACRFGRRYQPGYLGAVGTEGHPRGPYTLEPTI